MIEIVTHYPSVMSKQWSDGSEAPLKVSLLYFLATFYLLFTSYYHINFTIIISTAQALGQPCVMWLSEKQLYLILEVKEKLIE